MNTQTQHTPGPWTAKEHTFKGSCLFFIENESGQLTIAETRNDDADDQCIANAQLIAASPTMYSSIDECINRLQQCIDMWEMPDEAVAMIKGEIDALSHCLPY